MRIRWHGHACFEVAGSSVVVTDPHDGKSIGIKPPRASADVVLISHDHFDHNCARMVKGSDTAVIDQPIMTVEKGVRVEGVEAFHDDQEGAKRGTVNLYRFEMDGFSFCHLGDLGHALDDAQKDRLHRVDFLFVPVGDVFTIGPETARKVIEQVEPRIAIPMHYRTAGLSLSIRPLQDFLDVMGDTPVSRVGNEIDFSGEDLHDAKTEIWVFSE